MVDADGASVVAGWVLQDLGGGWRARYEIAFMDGESIVRCMTIEPSGQGAVSSVPDKLRMRLSPSRALMFARDPESWHGRAAISQDGERISVRGWGIGGLERMRPTPRRGRKGRSLREDAELAAIYAEVHKEVGQRGVIAETARRYGYSEKWTAKRIVVARHRGLLTKTSARRAGGELTELGRWVLGLGPSPVVAAGQRGLRNLDANPAFADLVYREQHEPSADDPSVFVPTGLLTGTGPHAGRAVDEAEELGLRRIATDGGDVWVVSGY